MAVVTTPKGTVHYQVEDRQGKRFDVPEKDYDPSKYAYVRMINDETGEKSYIPTENMDDARAIGGFREYRYGKSTVVKQPEKKKESPSQSSVSSKAQNVVSKKAAGDVKIGVETPKIEPAKPVEVPNVDANASTATGVSGGGMSESERTNFMLGNRDLMSYGAHTNNARVADWMNESKKEAGSFNVYGGKPTEYRTQEQRKSGRYRIFNDSMSKAQDKKVSESVSKTVDPIVNDITESVVNNADFKFSDITINDVVAAMGGNITQGALIGSSAAGMAGMAIGSVATPVGTAVGGGIGASTGAIVGGAVGAVKGVVDIYNRQISGKKSPAGVWNAIMSDVSQKRIYDAVKSKVFDKDGRYNKEITYAALMKGMKPEQYVRSYLIPMIASNVEQSHNAITEERYRVKGFGKFLENSLDHALFGLNAYASKSGSDREARSIANQNYDASMSESIGASALTATMDALGGGFGIGHGVQKGAEMTASAIGKTGIYQKVAGELTKRVSPWVSQFKGAGEKMANAFVTNNLGFVPQYIRSVATQLPGSVVNLSSYMGLSSGMQTASRMDATPDDYFLTDEQRAENERRLSVKRANALQSGADEWQAAQIQLDESEKVKPNAYDKALIVGSAILSETGSGIVSGAEFGGIMSLTGTAFNIGAMRMKSALGRGAVRVGGHVSEIGSMVGLDWLHEGADFNFTNSLANSIGMKVGLYVSGGGVSHDASDVVSTIGNTIQHGWKYLTSDTRGKGPKLTDRELDLCCKQIGIDPSAMSRNNKVLQVARALDKGYSVNNTAQNYVNLFDKTRVPFTTRQKLAYGMFGDIQSFMPLYYNYDIKGNDIYFRSKDGELIEIRPFTDKEHLSDIIYENGIKKAKQKFVANTLNLDDDVVNGVLVAAYKNVTGGVLSESDLDAYKKILVSDDLRGVYGTKADVIREASSLSIGLVHQMTMHSPEGVDASIESGFNDADKANLTGSTPDASVVAGVSDAYNKAKAEMDAIYAEGKNEYSVVRSILDNEDNKALISKAKSAIGSRGEVASDYAIASYLRENGYAELSDALEKQTDYFNRFLAAENRLKNAEARFNAFKKGVDQHIDEAVDVYYSGIRHRIGLEYDDDGISYAPTVDDYCVRVTDGVNEWYLRDGDVRGSKVESESGMVIVVDKNGNMDYKKADKLSVVSLTDKATEVDGLRQYIKEQIKAEYGIGDVEAEPQRTASGTQTPQTDEVQSAPKNDAGLVEDNSTEVVSQNDTSSETPAVDSATTEMPMTADGKPDYMRASTEQTYNYLEGKKEGDAKKRAVLHVSQIDAKIKALDKAEERGPKVTDDIDEWQDGIDAQRVELTKQKDYWQSVVDYATEIAKQKTAQAIAETKEQGVTSASNGIESGKVGKNVVDKFNGARKVVGRKGTITLPDGSKIGGTYMVIDAEGVTPSHDSNNDYKQNEGFPVTDDGKTANSRDYQNKDNREFTDGIAQHFNGLAVKNIPVVTKDGVVLSGNGTMAARQKSARMGTDKEYLDALDENIEGFGITADDIADVPNKTIVFVPDGDFDYTPKTFDLFNKRETKTESNTTEAVRNSKTLTPQEVGGIVSEIGTYGSLDYFFKSAKGISSLIKTLVDKGVIGQNEVAELMDGDLMSARGEEFVENLLLGSLFGEESIKKLGIEKGLKRKVLDAAKPIMDNAALGDYAIPEYLEEAISLLYEAKKAGMSIKGLFLQGDLFDDNASVRYSDMAKMLAIALEGRVGDFKKLLDLYNNNARTYSTEGQGELFSKPSKNELIREFINYVNKKENNGTGRTEQTAEPAKSADGRPQDKSNVASVPANDGRERAVETEEPKSAAEQAQELAEKKAQPFSWLDEYRSEKGIVHVPDDKLQEVANKFIEEFKSLHDGNMQGVISEMQRRLKIGFNTANRLVDRYNLEDAAGVIASYGPSLSDATGSMRKEYKKANDYLKGRVKEMSEEELKRLADGDNYTLRHFAEIELYVRNDKRNTPNQDKSVTEQAKDVADAKDSNNNAAQIAPGTLFEKNEKGFDDNTPVVHVVGYDKKKDKYLVEFAGSEGNLLGGLIFGDKEMSYDEIKNHIDNGDWKDTGKRVSRNKDTQMLEVHAESSNKAYTPSKERKSEKPKTEKKPLTDASWGSKNKVITKEKKDELLERLRKKRNNLNELVDPELLIIGTELAMYHIEAGAHKFKDYVKALVKDLLDAGFDKKDIEALKQEFKSWYAAASVRDEFDEISDNFDERKEIKATNVDDVLSDLDREIEEVTEKPVEAENNVEPQKDESSSAYNVEFKLSSEMTEEEKPKTKKGWMKAMSPIYDSMCKKVGLPSDNMYRDVHSSLWHGMTEGWPLDKFAAKYDEYVKKLAVLSPEPATDKQMDYIKKLSKIEGSDNDYWSIIKGGKYTKHAASYIIDLLKCSEDAHSLDEFNRVGEELEKVAELNGKPRKLSGNSKEYSNKVESRKSFKDAVLASLNDSLADESKRIKSINDLRNLAKEHGLEGMKDTDLQEIVESVIVDIARGIASNKELDAKSKFDKIRRLYEIQPSLNQRDTDRIMLQQYSTPAPMAFLLDMFVDPEGKAKSGLEPSAGNGMLTIGLSRDIMHVNDIDEMRLSNLNSQGFGIITNQDGTRPFGAKKYDVIVTNPPFGSAPAKEYDGYTITALEHQMAINALDSMKDNGRAAIIVGGNMEYMPNGAIKGAKDKAFYNYLYNNYNVVDVINMDGKKLYSRQGTGYDVRMILIDGRRTDKTEKRYAPIEKDARADKITDYEELYKRVNDDLLHNKERSWNSDNEEGGEGNGRHNNADATEVSTEGVRDVRTGGRSEQSELLAKDGQQLPESVGRRSTDSAGKLGGSRDDSEMGGDAGMGRPSSANDRGGKQPTDADRGAIDRSGRGVVGTSGRDNSERHVGGNDKSSELGQRWAKSSQGDNGVVAPNRELGTEKVPYRQQSSNPFSLNSLMPAEQADQVKAKLEEIGNVDEFVTRELGYSSVEEMHHGLAAEQVDSVAMAIHQMNQGNAFIIGDQTGIGKGRQAAALIRYGVKKGGFPVFVTVKKVLFSDMYRDLCDIGSPELRPFIWSADDEEHSCNVTDADGNMVYKRPSDKEQKRVVDYINKHGKLPPEYDYVLTTYDSFKSGTIDYENGEKKPRKFGKGQNPNNPLYKNGQQKRDAFEALASNSYVIMDESHNAGGEKSNVSGYLQYITKMSKGTTFLSATFAKRPGNMPIYSLRTAISKANVKVSELIEAVKKGGATFQEVMSKALTEAGQMIRRERDMTGVTIDWRGIEDEAVIQKQREQYDAVIGLFNKIIAFQKRYVDPIVCELNDEAAYVQGNVDHTPGTRDMGINNTPFASRTYNIVQQVLLSLKAEESANRAIEYLKKGMKPVICVANTNEKASEEASSMEEDMEMPDLSINLKKGLQSVLKITTKNGDGDGTNSTIPLDRLGDDGMRAYGELMDEIDNASSGLSLSPIDVIKDTLKKAGYNVGELTGRKAEFIYNDDGSVRRVKRDDTDKKKTAAMFNNGQLDALILNKSAGTGISLHASSKFKDQRQRVMIVAQAQGDVNDEVQIRGRIDRTGQVLRGMYEYVVSNIPSEQRLLMMLKSKLRSLDANTTSSQKSKFNEMEVLDVMNKYGDAILVQYLAEHPDIYTKLADPLKWGDDIYDKSPEELIKKASKQDEEGKTASKILGNMALLKVAEQEEMLNDITEIYKSEIDRLNDMGENDLEITEMPLKAKTLSKKVWEQGPEPNGGNPFADNTYIEEVEMDVLKKPMKSSEVKASQERFLGGKSYSEYAESKKQELDKWENDKIEKLKSEYEERAVRNATKEREKYLKGALKNMEKNGMSEEDCERMADAQYKITYDNIMSKLDAQVGNVKSQRKAFDMALESFDTDHAYVLPSDIYDLAQLGFGSHYGKVIDIKISNNFSIASSTITFATLDGRRKITVPISGMVKGKGGSKSNLFQWITTNTQHARQGVMGTNAMNELKVLEQNAENWDRLTATPSRKKGYIVTGNLLQALVSTSKSSLGGKIISYTTDTGEVRQGILMSDNFNPKRITGGKPISEAIDIIKGYEKVVSLDGKVSIERTYSNNYRLSVPKSKKQGEVFFNDEMIKNVVEDGYFYTRGGKMCAEIVGDNNLERVLRILSDKHKIQVQTDADGNINSIPDEGNKSEMMYGGGEIGDVSNDTEAKRVVTEFVNETIGGTDGLELVMNTQEEGQEGGEVLTTSNGIVYGWAEGNKVHLTPEGINPNTPIHEYTHLWVKAVQKKAPELWNNIKSLLKDNPLVKEVIGEKGYEGLTEDGLYSEVLSRVSGKKNAGKLEEAAQRLLDSGHSKEEVKGMLANFREAIKKAWSWIGENLFGIKKFDSVDEVTDRILYDLINKTNLGLDAEDGGTPEFHKVTAEEQKDPHVKKCVYELEHGEVIDVKTAKELVEIYKKNPNDPRVKDKNFKVKVIRGMQVLDVNGKKELFPPMAARIDGEYVEGAKGGEILVSDYNQELSFFKTADGRKIKVNDTSVHKVIETDKKGEYAAWYAGEVKPENKLKISNKGQEDIPRTEWQPSAWFVLDKGGNKNEPGQGDVTARTNPYWHVSNTTSNDQFAAAWVRPNLVSVECYVPFSELVSGHREWGAKNRVGFAPWKSGSVTEALIAQGHEGRTVALSRYCQIGRVLSAKETAEGIKEYIGKYDVEVPENVVTPQVRVELEKLGVKIGAPEKKVNKSEQIRELLELGLSVDNSLYKTSPYGSEMERSSASRENARAYAQDAINELGGKGKVFGSKEELDDEGKKALKKNSRAMGWYNTKTGEVCVYLPNCRSDYDIQRTIQHEKIGHEGLRKAMGDADFMRFQNKLWMSMDADSRKAIREKMSRNGWDLRVAMDEYMAERAEDFSDAGRSFIQKVKDTLSLVWRAFRGKPLTEKDVRMALWLSKNALGGSRNTFEYKVNKAAFGARLNRYNPKDWQDVDGKPYNDAEVQEARAKDMQELLFSSRMTDEQREQMLRGMKPEDRNDIIRYNQRFKDWRYVWSEAFGDRLKAARALMETITGKKGNAIDDELNIVNNLEALASKNRQGQDKLQREHIKPLYDFLLKAQTSFDGENNNERYKNLEAYAYIKHALERNRVLAVRDAVRKLSESTSKDKRDLADTIKTDFSNLRASLKQRLDAKSITLSAYYAEMDKFINDNIGDYDAGKMDKSGLSDVNSESLGKIGIPTGNKHEYNDVLAIKHVEDCESKMGDAVTKELWDRVDAIAKDNVEREYKAGLINRKAADRMNEMFHWYLPLRGFDADTAEDMYGYIDRDGVNNLGTNMKTRGRTSMADTPISTLCAMADYSILRSNKNVAKQALVRLARSKKSPLLSEYEAWYHETVQGGEAVLVAQHPEFREDMTAKKVRDAIDKFDADIEARIANGEKIYKLSDKKTNSPYRIINDNNKNQHIVSSFIDGKQVNVIVHGNPRAAQAINGMVHDAHWKGWDAMNRAMSQMMTSYSLTFMMRNATRDVEYASAGGFVGDFAKGEKWNRDFAKTYAHLATGGIFSKNNNNGMLSLFHRYRKGELANSTDVIEGYFVEFVENGGMTGYTQMKSVKDYEAELNRTLASAFDSNKHSGNKAMKYAALSGEALGKFVKGYFNGVETLNEAVENHARFSAYVASRMQHRNISRSVHDAKEISVNFNRTGAGYGTKSLHVENESAMWKINRNIAALSSTYLRHTMWFFNPGVQGMSRTYDLMTGGDAKQKTRFMSAFVVGPMLGCMVAQTASMVMAMLDTDEEKKKYGENPFDQLPDHVRRDNMCFYVGHGNFVMLPLSIEQRAAYGLADVASRMARGIRSEKGYGAEVFEQLTQLTPMDLGGGGKVAWNSGWGSALGTITPSNIQPVVACMTNVSWTGSAVSGRNSFNKYDAEWTRGLHTTGALYEGVARGLSVATGGDAHGVKGGAIDVNPAIMQYIVESYTGGPGKEIAEAGGRVLEAIKSGDVDYTKLPILKAYSRSARPENQIASDRARWYRYNDAFSETSSHLKGFYKAGETAEYHMLRNSPQGKTANIVAYYRPAIKHWQTVKNNAKSDMEYRYAQEQINEIIHKAVTDIDRVNK